ncbi:hypothetical protein [Vulgatibacter sp.]|uniref:hypothetical protein n=1 Tax=Vulgatibacter sp. TaxID=1971226 RepID=UPI003566695B
MRWLVLAVAFLVGAGVGWLVHGREEPVAAADPWGGGGLVVEEGAAVEAAGPGPVADGEDGLQGSEAFEMRRRDVHAALLAGALETADQRFSTLVEAEAALPHHERAPRETRELAARLAAGWHERGRVHEERQQLEAAFAAWARAAGLDPTHVESLAGLQRLELRAARLLAGDANCAALASITGTTRQESATHRAAAERLAGCGRHGR